MTANTSSFYLDYIEALAGKRSIIQYRSIGKKYVDVEYYAFPEEIESKNKITKICLGQAKQEIGQEKYLLLIIT